jgi:hypothetical protein
MKRLLLILVLLITPALAQNEQVGDLNSNTQNSTVDSNNPSTTNNYNGAGSSSDTTPPPTAVAPGVPSGGSESCLIGRSFGTQVNVLGLSFGGYKQDNECNRRRDANALKAQGMSIAAVSRLCQSIENWIAMFKSGTPCPFSVNGKLIVGRAAFIMMRQDPETFIPNYKDEKEYYDKILRIGQGENNEENSDVNLSISERFRSSSGTVD